MIAAEAQVMELERQIESLKAILAEIQWTGCLCMYPDDQGCPECGGHDYGPESGHGADCKIGLALK